MNDTSRRTRPGINEAALAAFATEVAQQLGLSRFSLSLRPGIAIELTSLIVDNAHRNRGRGSAAMERLIQFADEHAYRLTLSPALPNRHGTTSRARLVRFYKRFGFYENRGRRKDFGISAGMIREPRPLPESDLNADAAEELSVTPKP